MTCSMCRSFRRLTVFSVMMALTSVGAARHVAAADGFTMKRLERSSAANNSSPARPFIIGGKKADRARFPATVTLRGVGDCTATIVGERVALTAAHCVQNGGSGGIDLGDGSPLISATCTHHPEFQLSSDNCKTLFSGCTADVALCRFNSSLVAADLKYEVIQTDRAKVKTDTSMVLLGYGCTETGQTDPPTLFWGTAGIRRLSKDPAPNPEDAFMLVDGGAILCPGDSGSGDFDQDDPKTRFVIGVGVKSNETDKTSLLVQTTDERIKNWMNAWGDANMSSICGIHPAATGCR